MDEPNKRQVAYIVCINDILGGRYVKKEGWEPNTIITPAGREVSRVNIIAAVVDLPASGPDAPSITIDDGTGKIVCRTFEAQKIFDGLSMGELVLVIGKAREYGSDKYIIPEIIRRIDNPKWVELRLIQRKMASLAAPKAEFIPPADNSDFSDVVEEHLADEPAQGGRQNMVDIIRELDSGNGADCQEAIEKCGAQDGEALISRLIEEGEVFEISPGKLKVLE